MDITEALAVRTDLHTLAGPAAVGVAGDVAQAPHDTDRYCAPYRVPSNYL
jgi:hypothetical protein